MEMSYALIDIVYILCIVILVGGVFFWGFNMIIVAMALFVNFIMFCMEF
jgi:hypothetical protein